MAKRIKLVNRIPRTEQKAWRKAKKLTQEQWAKHMSVDKMTVWFWENDKNIIPHPLMIKRIRQYWPDAPILKEPQVRAIQ